MYLQLASAVIILYVFKRFGILRIMFKQGSPLFAVGYNLYTKTSLGSYLHGRDLRKTRIQFPEGHSIVEPTQLEGIIIIPIPYLKDNYAYLVIDRDTRLAAVVDPGDANSVQRVIEEQDVRLSAVLTTHKHWDHSGGNDKIKSLHPNLAIYGSREDQVPAATHIIRDGESVEVGNLKFTAIFTPGHTVGHTAFLLDRSGNNSPSSLFTGDLLFLGGNGRMFEGRSSLMLSSLDRVCQLPDDTLIWPGHEYALDNLEFVKNIDPRNQHAKNKLEEVEDKRKDKRITSPSTLGEEKTYNPFLRTSDDYILRMVDGDPEAASNRDALRAQALEFLRKAKDNFSYKL